MKWLWHLHKEWDKRVKDAHAEVEQSRRDLEEDRIRGLRLAQWREQNHFAELIRDTLLAGKEGK